MSEYWKSTPSYWCKFCSRYVRDSGIERRNHEASAQHQNNIQRSLRDLHKNREREEREKQRAQDEVRRLKGEKVLPRQVLPNGAQTASAPNLTAAQQRKAHAEQLIAMGIELSGDLRKEVTGIDEFKVVNQREIKNLQGGGSEIIARSMADILAEERARGARLYQDEDDTSGQSKKRKVEDDEDDDAGDPRDEEARPKRTAWGSNFKSYPGVQMDGGVDSSDLDALLKGVSAVKKEPSTKVEETGDGPVIKNEETADSSEPKLVHLSSESEPAFMPAKQEDRQGLHPTPATVLFKKRKGKK